MSLLSLRRITQRMAQSGVQEVLTGGVAMGSALGPVFATAEASSLPSPSSSHGLVRWPPAMLSTSSRALSPFVCHVTVYMFSLTTFSHAVLTDSLQPLASNFWPALQLPPAAPAGALPHYILVFLPFYPNHSGLGTSSSQLIEWLEAVPAFFSAL